MTTPSGDAMSPPDGTTPRFRTFALPSADGTILTGQVDLPNVPSGTAVIFASGSGFFDRDMIYGQTGTPRDKVFKDLGIRLTARGAMAVRADRRGIAYGITGPDAVDSTITGRITTRKQVEDLRALQDWALSPGGLGAARVVFLTHSEGTLHLGRLAASGAPAPARVVAIGALLESPRSVLRWQAAERDAESIASLDGNGDGVTTNDEVRSGLANTPSGVGPLETMLSESGAWDATALDAFRARQRTAYDAMRTAALAQSDEMPYPDAEPFMGSYEWWKSWFIDDTPNAVNLARWDTDYHFHIGSIDSQTSPARQEAAARAALKSGRFRLTVHQGLGHGLSRHPALGPIEEVVADQIADEAAFA